MAMSQNIYPHYIIAPLNSMQNRSSMALNAPVPGPQTIMSDIFLLATSSFELVDGLVVDVDLDVLLGCRLGEVIAAVVGLRHFGETPHVGAARQRTEN